MADWRLERRHFGVGGDSVVAFVVRGVSQFVDSSVARET